MDTLQDLHPRREKSNVPESQRCRSCQDNQPSSSVRPHASGDSENRSINQCIRSGDPSQWSGETSVAQAILVQDDLVFADSSLALCVLPVARSGLSLFLFSVEFMVRKGHEDPPSPNVSLVESPPEWRQVATTERNSAGQTKPYTIPTNSQRGPVSPDGISLAAQEKVDAFHKAREGTSVPPVGVRLDSCAQFVSVRAVGLLRSTQNSTVFRRKGSSVQQNSQRVCRVWIRAEAGCSWRPLQSEPSFTGCVSSSGGRGFQAEVAR